MIVEEKEERSKVATVAIVACGVVALIAIVLLCIVLFGGGSSDELINAPNLVGQMYDENKDYGDVLVEISNKQYSDRYAKGEIIEQIPVANKQMAKGDTIRVVISLGPQPEEKVMVDLTHVPQQQAIDFLDAMDIDLQFLTKMENSSEVEKGCVIRTNPVDGEPLEKGQTVYMWISTGPLKQTAKVPGVVGRNQSVAEAIMIGSQFNNLVFEEDIKYQHS